MSVKTISKDELRRMEGSEGLIIQGCGGSLDEWVDGINDMLTEDGKLQSVPTLRVYIIHIILQFIHDEETEYRGFRITATRDGIIACKELK